MIEKCARSLSFILPLLGRCLQNRDEILGSLSSIRFHLLNCPIHFTHFDVRFENLRISSLFLVVHHFPYSWHLFNYMSFRFFILKCLRKKGPTEIECDESFGKKNHLLKSFSSFASTVRWLSNNTEILLNMFT